MPEHKTPDPSAQNPPGESISQPPKTPQQTDQTNHPNEQKVKKMVLLPQHLNRIRIQIPPIEIIMN